MMRRSVTTLFAAGCMCIGQSSAFLQPAWLPASKAALYWVAKDGPTVDIDQPSRTTRRDVLKWASLVAFCTETAVPSIASARYVLDEETGDYVEVEEADWQTAWKQRLDKASNMSKDEIFQAARGAGNVDLREGPESDASKKRRAMSACRDASVRSKVGVGSEKDCTARVFAGEVDFMLDAL